MHDDRGREDGPVGEVAVQGVAWPTPARRAISDMPNEEPRLVMTSLAAGTIASRLRRASWRRALPEERMALRRSKLLTCVLAIATGTVLAGTAPVTWLGTGSGDRGADVALSATAYDVPAGDSLTLVVDTVDRSTTTTMRRTARSRSPAVPTSTSR
jgi:hypothetical protein